MAASKRKKKARKGKGRVKATDGGRSPAARSAPKKTKVERGNFLQDLIGPSPRGGGFLDTLGDPQKLIEFLTGQELVESNEAGQTNFSNLITELANRPDLPGHAEISRLLTERQGAIPASIAGFLQELPTGVEKRLTGNKFFGPEGFSLQDIGADVAGVARGANFPGIEDFASGLVQDSFENPESSLINRAERFGNQVLGGGPRQAPRKQRPVSSIPRGKHGGRMTAEAAASGRNVARQRFAIGGRAGISAFGSRPSNTGTPVSGGPIDIPGINTLPGQEQGPITQTSQTGTSESTAEGTSEESGTGFTQGIADTGALDSIVEQLRGIQGFSNLGRSTLDDILRTGLPTDVSGITEAAKIRAGQEFDDASNVIGERLANLGLVSSSAQTTAVARERAKLGERVSAAGMEAEVAAAEAAAGRRFGGVGLDTSGQNTRVGALGQAGSLARDSASLNRREETGFDRRGSTSSMTVGSTTSQGTTSLSNPLAGTIGGGSGRGGGGSDRVAQGPRTPVRGGLPRQLSRSRNFNAEAFSRFAHGGRVPELDNVLSGVLEGSTGFDVDTLTRADRLAAERGRIARFEEDNIGLANSRKEIGEFLSVNDPGILRMLLGGVGGAGALNVADPGTNVTPSMQSNIDRSAKSALERARPPIPRHNFALGGPVEGDPKPINAPNKGAVPQPTLPQEAGQVVPGILDPRRQFFEDGGGVAPGQDSGEDTVPAMLRPEELVITPELTEELMNVDPSLPQPALITALQQLAQQPLEFGEEEGELVASDGGLAPNPDLLELLMAAGIVPREQPEFGVPEFTNRGPALGIPGQDISVGEALSGSSASEPVPEFAGKFLPGAGTDLNAVLREEPDFAGPNDFSVPRPPLRAPSFSESVGEAGERKFTLVGGSSGTGRVGEAGIRAGLDPSKGLLTGGENFAPGASRQAPGSAGSVSGSAVAVDPETGLPIDFGGQQVSRLERAQRIADLTRSAISTDPVGGPQKQARMLRALEIANREVDSSVNEIIQGQKLAIERQQVQNAGVVAQGQLNASIAQTLQAQAQKVTAEGALAKQVAELAANNPVVTAAMNKLELLAKNPDMDPDDRDRILAILTRELQVAGIELTESGFFADLFGAPGFTISPTAQQQGVPDPDGANDGQQELQALMSRAKAGMSAEDFQHIMEIM